MNHVETISQALGIIGLLMNVLSFQQKTKKRLITVQWFGALSFSIHFLLLQAPTGCLLNILAFFRGMIFANKEKFKADRIFWLPVFFSLFIVSYLLSFTVFGTEPSAKNLLVEVLPVLGMMVSTVSFRTKNAATVRKLSLINSPLWLIYDALTLSVGGTLCEVISLISIIVGIFRLDLKKKDKTD